MNAINLAFILLLALIKNGFGSTDDMPDLMSLGMDKNMLESLYSKYEEDIALLKDLLPDPYEEPDSITKQLVQHFISKEFGSMISNLAEDDEFTYILKLEAIRRGVETAYQKAVGKIEMRYIDDLMEMIKNEVQSHKQKLSLERSNNSLK